MPAFSFLPARRLSDVNTEYALITGASGGIGEAFARELAARSSNVILAARNEDKLAALAQQLRDRYGVSAVVHPADLTNADDRAELVKLCQEKHIHTLVNNAGFGTLDDFVDIEAERLTREITLNVLALTELTHAVVPAMVARGRGAIINLSSVASFQPLPRMSVYAATKSYVLNFSISLAAELKDTGVRVTAVCPGPTATNFFANAGDDNAMTNRRTPEQVVATTFRALAANRPYVVDGAANAALALVAKTAPFSVSTAVAAQFTNN